LKSLKQSRELSRRKRASKETSAAEAIKDLLSQPKRVSRLMSTLFGEPIQIVNILDTSELVWEPTYPDLVIRHLERIWHFEFFAKGDGKTVPVDMALSYLTAARVDPNAKPIAVWVGDGLIDFEPRIDEPDAKFHCRIVDIREPFENDEHFDLVERQILSGLKAVDQAQGGLFRRLLELPPEQHQREFVGIAAALGYEAWAIRAGPTGRLAVAIAKRD
jgi:hypothetical protein